MQLRYSVLMIDLSVLRFIKYIYSQSTTNKMQRFSVYLFLEDALHVSDGFPVHHLELKTAHTASGIGLTNT